MEQCERQLRMAQDPVGIRRQLQQQQIIGEVFGETLGGIRMETVNHLRREALDLQNSLQKKDAEIKRLSEEAWKAKSETSLVQTNFRGKSAEWGQKGVDLRAAVAAEKKRANDAEMQLSDQTWIWNQEMRDLETALEKEKTRAEKQEERLRAEVRSAVAKCSSSEAIIARNLESIATLKKQAEEMARDRDSSTAHSTEMEERLQTLTAKIGFMATHRRILQESE
ncbi:hypothetical protein VE04_02281 [Pseudogymnoascus sp. 24MN13]|nr:hypothetical protein VE04_02281 [Pseudogymnoascus sp. 24MN13]